MKAPQGTVDTHSHVYGPPDPAARDARNPHPEAPVDAYRAMLERLGIERGVIVQPSAYGTDNQVTLGAVAALGLHRARCVVATPPDTPGAELRRLHVAGARGMRFVLFPGGALGLDSIEETAATVAGLGWHVQVQGHGEEAADWAPVLKRLPCDSVIDHIGRVPVQDGVDNPAFRALLALFDTGKLWIKLSAPYHTSETGPPLYDDLTDRVRLLADVRPDRLLWAVNWPHPRFPPDAKPDNAQFLDVLGHWIPDEKTRRAILVDNPSTLYGFD
ncbi:MAG: amidohydrolase family protein [Acetobacterales bacterium]